MSDLAAMSRTYFASLAEALAAIPEADILAAGALILDAYLAGQTIFVIGNGGSAATAGHMACDLAKTTLGPSQAPAGLRLRAIALTENTATMTAWSNDASYDEVFSQQLRNLGNPGDLLVAISASGNSPNILACLMAARELEVRSLGLLGFSGGRALDLCDRSVVVKSEDFGVIEDAHSALNHLFTAYIKRTMRARIAKSADEP